MRARVWLAGTVQHPDLLLLPFGEKVGMRGGCSRDRKSSSPLRRQGPSALRFTCCIVAICHFACRAFRPPAEGESLFSCLAKRKVTQREGHPAWRLPGMYAQQVRELGPGFSTAHPCAGEKGSASCRFPLRGLSTPSHRRTGAPGRAAGVLLAANIDAPVGATSVAMLFSVRD
jgi:hypothetical protein